MIEEVSEGVSLKPVFWVGDSRERLREFPDEVCSEIGNALYRAQLGKTHPSMKPLRGIGAVEIVSDYAGDTYRCVFTARLKGHIYVLHAFKKKSNSGSKTPKREVDLIEKHNKDAEAHYKAIKAERKRHDRNPR